jgi:predicted PurR-regulated permease PerM
VSVLTWALALAIVTNPLRRILHGRFSGTAVALLMVSVVLVVVVAVPAIFMSHRLMGEVMRGQQVLRGALQPATWQHAMGLRPLILLVVFVGGQIAFGAAGLILGPAIVALAIAPGEIWSARAVA